MSRTSCRAVLALSDVTARQDASYESSTVQSFVDLTAFNKQDAQHPKIGTLEDNFTWLDGTFDPMPDGGVKDLYWSKAMSDLSGNFSSPQTLLVAFGEPHSSIGLTLHFNRSTEDYADRIAVRWYDSYGNMVNSGTFYPDSTEYRVEGMVEEYGSIQIDFLHTNNPHRFVKLSGIDFGLAKLLGEDQIVSAVVLEEINPVSTEITINTLDLTIYSEDDEFSPLNPRGVFSYLQSRQAIEVYEAIDDQELFIGTYHLDRWDDVSDNKLTIRAIDRVGVMDQTNFLGGMYHQEPARTIIKEIMDSAAAQYDIDEELGSILLSGHIPICTHREALQHVAIAIGAMVDTSRTGSVILKPIPELSDGRITKAQKLVGGTVELKPLVSGVQVVSHTYIPSGESKELVNETFEPGTHEVRFSNPVYDLEASGAQIIESNVNYMIITVAAGRNVTVTGKEYVDTQRVYSRNAGLGTPTNVVEVKNATMIGPEVADSVATRLLSYYGNRYINRFSQLPSPHKVGKYVICESLRGENIRGYIESMRIDLTGGFISDTELVGHHIQVSLNDYAGEIYAGELIGVA